MIDNFQQVLRVFWFLGFFGGLVLGIRVSFCLTLPAGLCPCMLAQPAAACMHAPPAGPTGSPLAHALSDVVYPYALSLLASALRPLSSNLPGAEDAGPPEL